MEGWLYKRGKEPKPWAKRWFVLVDGRISYFNSPDDTRGTAKVLSSLCHPSDCPPTGLSPCSLLLSRSPPLF
jgi:hypothetical protein